MTFDIFTKGDAKELARSLFLQQHSGNETWFEIAWDVLSERSQTSITSDTHDLIPTLGIAGSADALTRNMAQAFALIAEAVLEELPTSGQAMLDRLEKKRPSSPKETRILERLKAALKTKIKAVPDYVVWSGGAEDEVRTPKPAYVGADELATRFLPLRGKVEFFIYNGEVTRLGDNIPSKELEDRHVRMLTCLLIYRGQALSTISFFKAVARKPVPSGSGGPDLIEAYLSPTMSELRSATGFPDRKKRGKDYLFDSRVSFVVILPISEEGAFAGLHAR